MSAKKKLLSALLLSSIAAGTIGPAWSGPVIITNTFSNGTVADADEVNQNFDDVKSAVDDNDSRIGTNAADILDNSADVAVNAAAIAANEAAIAKLFGGDGSGGPLDVTASVSFESAPPANLNFTDVTIASGQILTVPAGTTIRCSGSFTNSGTIDVTAGAKLRGTRIVGASQGMAGTSHPGDSYAAAEMGLYTNVKGVSLTAGAGGEPVPQAVATSSFDGFRIGGGAGGGFADGGFGFSSAGGGLIKIYCAGPIVNLGSITANANSAQTGTGGGGGGIVVLASRASVDNSGGAINARGSDGGQDFTCCGPGGGGGGGIVVLAAPSVTTLGGTIDVSGGLGRTATSTASQTTVSSGGGGGASGGRGGSGGSVSAADVIGNSANGADGYFVELLADPATLVH